MVLLNQTLQDQGINKVKIEEFIIDYEILQYVLFIKWQNVLRNKCSKRCARLLQGKLQNLILRDIGENLIK